MCATGDPLTAAAALEVGIIDRILDGDPLTGALEFARSGLRIRKNRELPVTGDPAIITAARENTPRNREAPKAVIDAIEAAATLPFDDGCRREAELFERCLFSTQAKALIYCFFAERE